MCIWLWKRGGVHFRHTHYALRLDGGVGAAPSVSAISFYPTTHQVLRQVSNNLQTRVFGLLSAQSPNSECLWHKNDTYYPLPLEYLVVNLG
jgi:hypothetical protein